MVQYGKYGAINKTGPSTMGYYVIQFVSEAYNLQEDTRYDGKIISDDELAVKAHHLGCTQERTN